MFHLFPTLPIELRLEIWSLCRSSRIISVARDVKFEEEHPGRHRCKTQASCPAILVACHESRSVALQFYRPTFHAQLPHPIYFDYTLDSIYMLDLSTSSSFRAATNESHRLRKASDINAVLSPQKAVRIVTQFESSQQWSERLLMRELIGLDSLFPCLRELIVVDYHSRIWTEAEFKVRIPREGSYKGAYRGKRIGAHQRLNGRFVAAPGHFVPEIVFWSNEMLMSWMTT